MIARRCDRCGDFYVMVDYKRSIITIPTLNESDRQFDLCPDCMTDFELWIANKAIILEKDGE